MHSKRVVRTVGRCASSDRMTLAPEIAEHVNGDRVRWLTQLRFLVESIVSVDSDAITVNGISPGPFDTEMNESLSAEARAQFVAGVPLGRWGKVEEVGALAVFLCSDDAGFITGTDIVIDGGWCAR